MSVLNVMSVAKVKVAAVRTVRQSSGGSIQSGKDPMPLCDGAAESSKDIMASCESTMATVVTLESIFAELKTLTTEIEAQT
jgi:hypothetical protein